MDYPDLKNCPFCDRVPHLRTIYEAVMPESVPLLGNKAGDQIELDTLIKCDECGIQISAEYQSEAVEIWNNRSGQEVKVLANILENIQFFEQKTGEAQYTDIGEVWTLLENWRDLITPLVPESELEEETGA